MTAPFRKPATTSTRIRQFIPVGLSFTSEPDVPIPSIVTKIALQLRIARPVDLTHTAFAEQRRDLVRSKVCPDEISHEIARL